MRNCFEEVRMDVVTFAVEDVIRTSEIVTPETPLSELI